MSICQEHNLVAPLTTDKRFGIRVRVRGSDPFCNLVGNNWQREHWFASGSERDEAFASMSGKYIYFRPGDRPSLQYEKINR